MSELPKPIAITKDKVVLTRSGWNAVIEALEDAQDLAAVRASLSRRSAGKDDGLPVALYRRMRAGEHPIRVRRPRPHQPPIPPARPDSLAVALLSGNRKDQKARNRRAATPNRRRLRPAIR